MRRGGPGMGRVLIPKERRADLIGARLQRPIMCRQRYALDKNRGWRASAARNFYRQSVYPPSGHGRMVRVLGSGGSACPIPASEQHS